MKTLILETATEKAALVLACGTKVVAHRPLLGGSHLSKTIALEVSLLLEKHDFKPEKIAVGRGPGSFTGVRVGTALGQALSFGWKVPLVSICTLLSFGPPPQADVLIDARLGGIYGLRDGVVTLFSIEEAKEMFENSALILSPHPELIRKRVSFNCPVIEAAPDPAHMALLTNPTPEASRF